MFHMPLFFFLAGLCYNGIKYTTLKKLLLVRTKQLFVPAIVFSLIIYLASELCHLNMCNFSEGLPGGLCFLLILFLVELIYWPIGLLSNEFYKYAIITLLFIISLAISNIEISSFYSLKTTPIALFYYVFGNIMRPNTILFSRRKNTLYHLRILVVTMFFLTIPFVYIIQIHDTFHLISGHIPTPACISIIISLFGIVGICLLSSIINIHLCKETLIYIGRNTLTILAVHMFFIEFSGHYTKPILSNNLLYQPFKFLFIVLATWLCILFINKRCRWIIGK